MAKMTVDELQVLITANAASFNKQLQAVQRQLDGVGKQAQAQAGAMTRSFSAAKVAAAAAIAAIGVAVGKMVTASTRQFGDFEQNVGGAKAIYGEYAGYVQKKAWEAARTMGMSMNEYMQTANKIGAIMQGSGMDQASALKMTTEWMQRAADQASVMGVTTREAMEAITGAAKGNFMMMDNIGVKMNATTLEAYALSKGISTAFDKMSEAQKVGLAYELFMERTGYAMGNFAREGATTMNGALATLRASFANLGAMMGQAFAPVVMQVANFVSTYLIPALASAVPYVMALMNVIGQMVSYVGGLLSGLFGGSGTEAIQSVGAAADSTAASVNKVGAAAGGAGKALGGAAKQAKKLKGQLAGFDEMNVLPDPQSSSSGGGGAGGGGGGAAPNFKMPKMPKFNPFEGMDKRAKDISDKIKKIFAEMFDFGPIGKSAKVFFTGLMDLVKGLAVIGDGFVKKFIIPVAKFQIEDSIPRILEAIGRALSAIDFSTISDAANGVFTHLAGLINSISSAFADIISVLAPVGAWFANFVVPPALEILSAGLMVARAAFDGIWFAMQAIGAILEPIFTAFAAQIEPLLTLLGKLFKWVQQNDTIMNILKTSMIAVGIVILGPIVASLAALGAALTAVTFLVNKAVEMFTAGWSSVKVVWSAAGGFFSGIWSGITSTFSGVRSFFSDMFTSAYNAVRGVWSGITGFFSNAWSVVKNTFSGVVSWIKSTFLGAWSSAWNGVKNAFSNIANGIGNAFKAPINFIIDIINKFIEGLNHIKVPDWVPAVGGKGINIPKIPKLARGGLVSGATIAMIGEAGREAVLPLDRNTGWMDELAAKIGGNGGSVNLLLQIDGKDIPFSAEVVADALNDAAFLRNGTLINI